MDKSLFADLEAWLEAGCPAPFDVGELSTIDEALRRAIEARDAEALDALVEALGALEAAILDRLEAKGLSVGELQAAAFPTLAGQARAALFDLKQDDPDELVKTVRNAGPFLLVLASAQSDLNYGDILARWPETEKPSASTLSRTAAALEGAGLVLRLGVTRGRTCRLLPRGRRWVDSTQERLGVRVATPVAPVAPKNVRTRTVGGQAAADFQRLCEAP